MSKLAGLVAGIGLLAAGCTKSNPVSCRDGFCQDPALPFCDVDGALSGTPQTCVAVDCSPGDIAGCRDDMALVCNTAGDNYDLSHCDHGCDPEIGCTQVACVSDTVACGEHTVERCSSAGELSTEACAGECVDNPSPHCAYISPMFLPDVCDVPAAEPSMTIIGTQVVDTNVDAFCNGGIVPQAGGPDICVVRYGTFRLDGVWTVTGERVLAIVTDGSLFIANLLDVSSSGSLDGPGSSRGGFGGTRSHGGAGFATAGGDAGGDPGSGGAPYDPLSLNFLAAGRIGGIKDTTCGSGGAGGGGATLISCRGTVSVEGAIHANGEGGRGGHLQSMSIPCGGAGGGAGGFVLLQGLDVRVTGSVFANGGGGGCGYQDSPGPDGADGVNSVGPATSCISANGATGGVGGTASNAPGAGLVAGSMGRFGGGGGSKGFFQSATPTGVVPTLTPVHASPPFGQNRNVPTR